MLAEGLTAKQVMTIENRETRRFAAQKAEATLAQARANLQSALTDLERLTVRAPVDGQVLQLNVHLGEFAPTGVLQTPLILFGSVDPVYVRVNVDENEAWRVRSFAAAIGYLRGNKEVSYRSPPPFQRPPYPMSLGVGSGKCEIPRRLRCACTRQ